MTRKQEAGAQTRRSFEGKDEFQGLEAVVRHYIRTWRPVMQEEWQFYRSLSPEEATRSAVGTDFGWEAASAPAAIEARSAW